MIQFQSKKWVNFEKKKKFKKIIEERRGKSVEVSAKIFFYVSLSNFIRVWVIQCRLWDLCVCVWWCAHNRRGLSVTRFYSPFRKIERHFQFTRYCCWFFAIWCDVFFLLLCLLCALLRLLSLVFLRSRVCNGGGFICVEEKKNKERIIFVEENHWKSIFIPMRMKNIQISTEEKQEISFNL